MVKTDKISPAAKMALLLVTLFSFAMVSGCANALFTAAYLIKGNEVDPEFKKEMKEIPKKSKMVVICRSPYQTLFGIDDPSRTLSVALTKALSEKLDEKKKLEWVPIDTVETLFDETEFTNESFEKMGAKVGADYVFGVDIDSFNIHHSPQYLQGKAHVNVKLVEVESGKTICSKSLPQYVYPPNTPVAVGDMLEERFQTLYIIKLADEIGCCFYPYDPHEKVALDNDVSRLR
ncbi:MAG: hypothetical protein IJG60_00390 [Thermoguttaceae bacterium]|nr:hypothetical protein [Thermoguttaceae bacterium]